MMVWAFENRRGPNDIHDCPWHEWTSSAVAERGHLDVFNWAAKCGCPWAGELDSVVGRCMFNR